MKNPLSIQLKELPEQGRDFHFTRKSGELNQVLKSFAGDNPYDIQIHIRRSGPSYLIQGNIEVWLNLICSRCAVDFKYKLSKSFRESLVIQPKKSGGKKVIRLSCNVRGDGEDFCAVLSDSLFSIGDFLRELITVEEPLRPLGKENCDSDDSCENLTAFRAETKVRPTGSPFEKLRDLLEPSP